MANDLDSLIRNLDRFRQTARDGAAAGLDVECPFIRAELQATSAHGDVTGATRAGYDARRVGRGEDGSSSRQSAVSAAESLNPGATASAPVTIDAELGVIIDDQMEYGPDRETRNAGEKASIGPIVGTAAIGLTQAAAAGSRKALGGG